MMVWAEVVPMAVVPPEEMEMVEVVEVVVEQCRGGDG